MTKRLRYSVSWCLGAVIQLGTALAGVAAGSVPNAKTEQQVIFMLDVSGSMPKARDGVTFEDEVQRARVAAERILDELEGKSFSGSRVGFWVFGEKGKQRPFDEASLDLPPGQAKGRLSDFFFADPARYTHQHTYIARSIFQLAWKHLGIDPFTKTPDDDIPADATTFHILVFTDGEEAPAKADAAENRLYVEWLARQQKRLQVRWQRWKLYADDAERARQEAALPAPAPPAASAAPPDQISYTVHFGVPTDAYSFDPEKALPAAGRAEARIPETIRLVPGRPPTTEEEASLGACVCRPPNLVAEIPAVSGGALRVQSVVEWKLGEPVTGGATWSIEAPGRPTSPAADPQTGTARALMSRAPLYLRILTPAEFTLNTERIRQAFLSSVPRLEFPIRLEAGSLCSELLRLYPNSTFIIPSEGDSADAPKACSPARLGNIVVDRRPRYRFRVSVLDGTQPDAPIDLEVDRWHLYRRLERRFRITSDAPAAVGAAIDVTAAMFRSGEALGEAADFVRVGDAGSGSLTVKPDQTFDVSLPAEPQPWWKSALGLGFDRPDGRYELRLRLAPRLASPPPGGHRTLMECDQCGMGARVDDRSLALSIAVTVQRKPLSWRWFLGAAAVAVLVLWAAVRWSNRRQFPEGVACGDVDLRRAHARGLQGRWALFWRKPLYLQLYTSGRVSAWRKRPPVRPKNPTTTGGEVTMSVMGLRPLTGSGQALAWCLSVADHPEPGCRFEIHLEGPLPRTEREPTMALAGAAVQVDLENLARARTAVELRKIGPKGEPELVTSYWFTRKST